jgi:hypothetical protein
VAVGGCGGDDPKVKDSPRADTAGTTATAPPATTPTVTTPEDSPATAPQAPGEGDGAGDGGGSGGTPAPGGSTTPEDSAQNDTPPPSGSPAERYEQYCEDHPGACD